MDGQALDALGSLHKATDLLKQRENLHSGLVQSLLVHWEQKGNIFSLEVLIGLGSYRQFAFL